jgi:hypothetical protein
VSVEQLRTPGTDDITDDRGEGDFRGGSRCGGGRADEGSREGEDEGFDGNHCGRVR